MSRDMSVSDLKTLNTGGPPEKRAENGGGGHRCGARRGCTVRRRLRLGRAVDDEVGTAGAIGARSMERVSRATLKATPPVTALAMAPSLEASSLWLGIGLLGQGIATYRA